MHEAQHSTDRSTSQVPAACWSDPDAWDLDEVDLPSALRALRACRDCPRLALCEQGLGEQLALDQPPQGLIQAGRAFTGSGGILTSAALVQYLSAGNRRHRTEQLQRRVA